MGCLAAHGQCLIGAQEVVDLLRSEGGSGSQASVYRVLDELHGMGLLHRHAAPNGTARYEIALPGTHHHHLVDAASGDVVPFHDAELEAAIAGAARRLGVEMTAHEVVITGRRPPRVPGAGGGPGAPTAS